MKKGVLILLGMFMMVSTVEAKTGKLPTSKIGVKYLYDDAVSFVERGIKFHVFLNGDFDFNSKRNNTYYDYNGRRTKARGVRIERDYNGKIRRVGNVFINYDYRGNVKRIGNIFMKYNRGNLTKVGGLRITYNRWGYPRFYGHVKNNGYHYNDSSFNINIGFGNVWDYDDAYFYRQDFRNNYSKFREDKDFYYYRAKPNAKIGKRSKVLKRRKKTVRKLNKRKTNNSYKKTETNKKLKRKTIKKEEKVIKRRRG